MFYESNIHVIGKTNDVKVKETNVLYDATNAPIKSQPPVQDERQAIMERIAAIQAEIAKKKGETTVEEKKEVRATGAEGKKNHRAVKPQAGRKYVLLSKSLADWGKVPQQQKDLATILADAFAPNVEVEEAEVFAKVTEGAAKYPSLAGSVQHPTYLLAYYRGFDKKDSQYGSFIKRNFLQVKG